MEVSYFNLGRNVWEPLLEPAVDPADEDVYSPWTLRTNVSGLIDLYHSLLSNLLSLALFKAKFSTTVTNFGRC